VGTCTPTIVKIFAPLKNFIVERICSPGGYPAHPGPHPSHLTASYAMIISVNNSQTESQLRAESYSSAATNGFFSVEEILGCQISNQLTISSFFMGQQPQK